MDCIFTRDGAAWLPTSAAMGPWGASLHGGAPAALLAHLIEAAGGGRFPLARLTLDLFRPVPAAALEVTLRPLRQGRRLLVHEAVLSAGNVELVRAVGVHGDEVALPQLSSAPSPDQVEPPACPLPALTEVTETSLAGSFSDAQRPAGVDGLHHRLRVRRGEGAPGSGRGSAWMHLPLELAPGLALSPTVHLAACSDFANGLAQRVIPVEGGSIGFINADISLHLLRAPAANRIGMIARNEVQSAGRALVSAECWQEDGLLARVTQTALVMMRGAGR